MRRVNYRLYAGIAEASMKKKPAPRHNTTSASSNVTKPEPSLKGSPPPVPLPAPTSSGNASSSQPTSGPRRRFAQFQPPADCTSRCYKKQAKNGAREMVPAASGGTRMTKTTDRSCICESIHTLRVMGCIPSFRAKRLAHENGPDRKDGTNATTDRSVQAEEKAKSSSQDNVPGSGAEE